jgi:hypothetical protein
LSIGQAVAVIVQSVADFRGGLNILLTGAILAVRATAHAISANTSQTSVTNLRIAGLTNRLRLMMLLMIVHNGIIGTVGIAIQAQKQKTPADSQPKVSHPKPPYSKLS